MSRRVWCCCLNWTRFIRPLTSRTSFDITQRRLFNQRIAGDKFKTPQEVVGWLGAVQAQDFFGAQWALGLRMESATDKIIEQAFNEGSILRTHLLRPTWHFVTPADIRWLLALTAPRVHMINGTMYRMMELDEATLKRSSHIIATALQGGNHLTREALRNSVEAAGIATGKAQRMSYIMMYAELEGIVCSGPRQGRQFTYALLEERAPFARGMAADEALAELIRQFFTSHGPATVYDFSKWSGLTVTSAREGLVSLKGQLESEVVGDQTYWFAPGTQPAPQASPAAYLLSVYDEYVSGYKDYSPIVEQPVGEAMWAMGNALTNIIVVDGQIVGSWKRKIRKSAVEITINSLAPLTDAGWQAVAAAAERYGTFLGQPVRLNRASQSGIN